MNSSERLDGNVNPITPSPEISPEREKSIREKVVFPHADAVVKLFQSQFEDKMHPVNPERIKDILWAFLEQRLENTEVYKSENYEASFPWTVTDTGELAKKLYSQYAGISIEELSKNLKQNDNELNKSKKEFVFTTFIRPQDGNQFTFQEEPMHQAIKDLPAALVALNQGLEPNRNKIYTVGSPTNELGSISPEFAENCKNDQAFGHFGKLYCEFVGSQLPKDEKERSNTNLYLYGISMGASFAVNTADRLLRDKVATQSQAKPKTSNPPFLQVRIDTPPGTSDVPRALKRWQIPVGFLLESTYTMATDPYLRAVIGQDKDFLASVSAVIKEEKGISADMSSEQTQLKKKTISEVIENLRNGTPIPEGVKVTEVVGVYDLLMYKNSFRKKLNEQRESYAGSIGETLVSDPEKENRRTFGSSMSHATPYFRENELRRLQAAAESLENLKK